jgi:thiamine-monophosphate kinase
MKVDGLGEFGLLERIKPYLEDRAGRDDVAVLEDGAGFMVVSCDTFVEGVHFNLDWMSADDAGWRALALALGDLAAKGATPTWALTTIAMPREWDVENLVGLYRGMGDLAAKTQLAIVGGDTSSTKGPAVLSITVAGRTETWPIERSEAKPGWAVAVTGPLGAAAVALREKRALRLWPQLEVGRRMNAAGLCCGDISDGLLREMEKFAEFSGSGCRIRVDDVPVVKGARPLDALASGEEAELVCVGPLDSIRSVGLKPCGVLTSDRAVRMVLKDGTTMPIKLSGFDHFA